MQASPTIRRISNLAKKLEIRQHSNSNSNFVTSLLVEAMMSVRGKVSLRHWFFEKAATLLRPQMSCHTQSMHVQQVPVSPLCRRCCLLCMHAQLDVIHELAL